MKVLIKNEKLLEVLAIVASVAERRQIMPILAHLYFSVKGKRLTFIGTDTEVEVTGYLTLDEEGPDMEGTIPARKFLNICRSFSADSMISIAYENTNFLISCGDSQFELSSLASGDFPIMEAPAAEESKISFSINKNELINHLNVTMSCMARNDVRFYLNGILFDFITDGLSLVATDGHRLAVSRYNTSQLTQEQVKCIVPHKGVSEMMRLISNIKDKAELVFYSNFLQISGDLFSYSCKLIDAPFPDYQRVIPEDATEEAIVDINNLRNSLQRCAILGQDTGEKHHKVELALSGQSMHLFSTNRNEEKVNERIGIQYAGENITLKFNVFYLLDILNVLKEGALSIKLKDANSSALIQKQGDNDTRFVVMPMKS